MTQPVLKVFLKDGAKLPAYAHVGDSGLDLAVRTPLVLRPFRRVTVDTGVHVEIPAGFEAHVRPRSGGNKRGLHVAFGTVDGPYRGPIGVTLYWMPELDFGFDGYLRVRSGEPQALEFAAGDRVAQLVIAPVAIVKVEQVQSLAELSETERGEAGWGSSGR